MNFNNKETFSSSPNKSKTAKKPFYMKWWVWVLALVVVIGAFSDNDASTEESNDTKSIELITEEPIAEDVSVETDDLVENPENNILNGISFEGYNLIEVAGGDMSTTREANVVVNIGFGNRDYYAFTNEYGQVVRVEAAEIILQDDSSEPVHSNGRYYSDEADLVNGITGYDNGHIIADCLGGVANAYNITPQESNLNQHGDQAYMEHIILSANGCTDFVAIITYPDTNTMIPSSYKFTFKINGEEVEPFEFKNENPEAVKLLETETVDSSDSVRSTNDDESDNGGSVEIIKLDKKAEYVIIKNNSNSEVNLKGWKLLSVRGEQYYIFGDYTLAQGESLKIGDKEKNPDVDIHWLEGRGIWNNTKDDDAELYNAEGILVSHYDD